MFGIPTTLFQAVQSDVFLSDCKSFFHDAASFIQTFISISIASIPVPATHIPTTNISNNQYMIPAINACGILVLICAAECPAAIVHPIKVCMNDAASWKNDLQSERNTSDCTDRNKGYRII